MVLVFSHSLTVFICSLQRHFSVFAVSFPSLDSLRVIYQNILNGHLKTAKFATSVQKISEKLIQGAVSLHQKVAATFLPTAIKFHYIFNLRDLSNIFQVCSCMEPLCYFATLGNVSTPNVQHFPFFPTLFLPLRGFCSQLRTVSRHPWTLCDCGFMKLRGCMGTSLWRRRTLETCRS